MSSMIWTGIEFGFGLALGVVLLVFVLRHAGSIAKLLAAIALVFVSIAVLHSFPWLYAPLAIIVGIALAIWACREALTKCTHEVSTHSPSRSSSSSPSQLTSGDQASDPRSRQEFLPSGPSQG